MITPQTNTSLKDIANALMRTDKICVCGHINPDGDCIGSTLALVLALETLGKDATPLIAQDFKIDKNLSFLPIANKAISAKTLFELNPAPYDAFVCVDVPNDKRMGEYATKIKNQAKLTITVDHHAAPERSSELSYTDPDATSTTLLVWELCKQLGINASTSNVSDIATCIFAGLLTDSGCFINQNVNALTFKYAEELVNLGANSSDIASHIYQTRSLAALKIDSIVTENMSLITTNSKLTCAISFISKDDMDALDAIDADAENTVSLLRSIDGVDVACMLKQRGSEVRASLRAKDNSDVSAIANEFGGGGHKSAAGFSLECSMKQAINLVTDRLSKL